MLIKNQNYMKKIIQGLILSLILGILLFPFISSAFCVIALTGGSVSNVQQMQIQMQGIATTNSGILPIGTKISYSISRVVNTCGDSGEKGNFIINKVDGQYGPSSISIPVDTTYLYLTIGSIPQDYLNGKIITGNQSLNFTITPDMAGTTITQNLAFNANITNPPPPPPPLYPLLGSTNTSTITPAPIVTPSPEPNPTQIPVISTKTREQQALYDELNSLKKIHSDISVPVEIKTTTPTITPVTTVTKTVVPTTTTISVQTPTSTSKTNSKQSVKVNSPKTPVTSTVTTLTNTQASNTIATTNTASAATPTIPISKKWEWTRIFQFWKWFK